MDYQIAKLEHLDQIIEMKNLVRQKIKDEKLDIWRNNYPLDELLKEDIVNKLGRVVVYQNKIIAYAVFYHSSYEYKNCFKKSNVYSFGRLMVHPDFQSKKVGSFIVAQMIEEAKSLHLEGIGIGVDECNVKAINLYKKHGFVKEGEQNFPWAYLSLYALYF
jgi:ribosomal protein S18 acetylase RimI-like enzyme